MPEVKDPFLEAGGLTPFIDNFEKKYGDKWLNPDAVSEMLMKEFPQSEAVKKLTTTHKHKIAEDIDDYLEFNNMQGKVAAEDPSMKPINAMVSGGLTAASLFTPGGTAVKIPSTGFDLLKSGLGALAVGKNMKDAPPILSGDNLLSLLGIGGNVATAKTALKGMPGIASAVEGGLASGIDQAAQSGKIDPLDVGLSMGLNGAVGGFAGRFAKRAGETSPRKIEEMEDLVGKRPTISSQYLVEDKTKKVINDVFRGGMGSNTATKEIAIKKLSDIYTNSLPEEKERIKNNVINDVFARVKDRISGPISGEQVGRFRAFVDNDKQFRELLSNMYGKSGPTGFSSFAHAMDTLAKIEHPELRLSLSKGAVRDTLAYLHVGQFVYLLSPSRIAENIQQGKIPLLNKFAQSAEEIASKKEAATSGNNLSDMFGAYKKAEDGNWINRESKNIADILFGKKDKSATTTSGLRLGFREARKGDEPKGGDAMENLKSALNEFGFEKIKLNPTQTPQGYLDYVREAIQTGMN